MSPAEAGGPGGAEGDRAGGGGGIGTTGAVTSGMQIAVVGSSAFVTGFRLAGVEEVFPVTGEELEGAVRGVLDRTDVGILVLHNEDYKRLSKPLRQACADSVEPVVIPIGKEEETDLRDRIKQAVGVDLWKQ